MNPEVLGEKMSTIAGKWVNIDPKTERLLDNLQRLHQDSVQKGIADQRLQKIEKYLESHPEINAILFTFFKADITNGRFNYLTDSANIAKILRDIDISCFSTEIVQYVQSKFYVRAQLSFIPKTNTENITRYGVKVDNGQFFESAEGMVAELFKRFPNEVKAIKNILGQFLKELAGSKSWCKEQELLNAIEKFKADLEQEIVKL